MKRYGQRVITLKDMLVEYLLAHMEGATFVQLIKELGASRSGLKTVVDKMEAAGELKKVRLPHPAYPATIDLMKSPGAEEAIDEYVAELLERHRTRTIIPPVQLTHDALDRQVDTDKPVKVIDAAPAPPDARSVGYSVGVSLEREIDHQTGDLAAATPIHEEGAFQEEPFSQEAIEQVVSMAGVFARAKVTSAWEVTRNDEVFKLSPRMWIEETTGI